ncbi:MAG: sulfite dehydrogenase, partial [Gemmatimonadota bacterium]|nr:sulfite dehydrogenase [Gemmatimonadota bacterium]
GNTSVKWLRRIELSDRPFMTRDETSRYTEPISDGRVRQFSFVMDARSLITSPGYPQVVEPGWIEIRGIAWSGRGKIDRVDISVDDGRTWVSGDLQEPVLPKAFTRFRYLWEWDGRETAVWSRAVDETGYVQPSAQEFIAARTARSSYHHNPTTGWRIRSDGSVVYRTQEWA